MTAPEKWLDAAALDLLHDENAHDLLGNYPEVISQARAALALRDEACRYYNADGTFVVMESPEAVIAARKAAAVELAECRAKLAQAAPQECPECGPHITVDEDGCCATCGADTVPVDLRAKLAAVQRSALTLETAQGVELSHLREQHAAWHTAISEREGLLERDAVMTARVEELEAKLAQAERERNEARMLSCGGDAFALRRDLAASQARERELREDLLRIEMGCSCGCDDFAAKALARPVDNAALREMLGECATDAVDRYIADGCTASEAASATVSRLLGGGK